MSRRVLAGLVVLVYFPIGKPLAAEPPAHESASRTQTYRLNIGRVPLAEALREFTVQSHIYIGFIPNDPVDEFTKVGPLNGDYSADEALQILLAPVRLRSRWLNSQLIAIERDTTGSVARDVVGAEPASTHPGAGPQLQVPASTSAVVSEEVTVISDPLRDLTLHPAPAVVIERDQIARIGASTVPELLESLTQSPYTRAEGFRASGAQYAELRGLGSDTTLVLINGQRTFASANSVTSNAFDLNSVPISAVERIEVLLDSASVSYGIDAIGGVVNIVLRDEVAAPSVSVQYGAASGGAEQRRATASIGAGNADLKSTLVVDYVELGGLLGGERERWRDQNFERFGSRDQRSATSSPGNISSLTGENLPGLDASFAAVPLTDDTAGISIDDFRATAGTRNLRSVLQDASIVPASQRLSLVGSAVAQWGAHLLASSELLYVERETQFVTVPALLPGVRVPASNVFNPFGTDVLVNTVLPGFDAQRMATQSTLIRGSTALKGDWRSWEWDLSVLHSKEDAQISIQNVPNVPAILRVLANDDPSQTLNLFQNGPVAERSLIRELTLPADPEELSSSGTLLAAAVKGAVMPVPAGQLTAALGAEWRREVANFEAPMGSFDRDVRAQYATLRMPLVSERMGVPAIRELAVTVGARADHYSDVGSFERAQYGLQWAVHPRLSVRASAGRSLRVPSLYELYFPTLQLPQHISDPARGGEVLNVAVKSGGNRELQPTTGETFTAGLEVESADHVQWRLGADYWRVRMDRRVSTLPPATLLANESLFAERIERAAPTTEDLDQNRPGRVLSVDTSRMNSGRLETSGIDVKGSYRVDTRWGPLNSDLTATWVDEFAIADVRGHTPRNRVGIADPAGTVTDWRAVLSVHWRSGAFGASTLVRYTPSYWDWSGGVKLNRKVEAQTLLDLQASLDLGGISSPDIFHQMKLTVGAKNIFDEPPSFAEVGAGTGFDISQGDLKQRAYYFRLDKVF